ncbi:MAG TPA: hypothetical protein VGI19_17005, partial [Candidatus Cybelea sp.]
MAGKVRIFELAKEVGLTSKELTTLFNERLGGVFEAKNQLSVVPDQIADLVRSVLLKPTPQAPPKTSAPAPVPVAAAAAAAAPAAPPQPAPAKPAAPPPEPAPPVARLRPVAPTTRTIARPAAPPAPERPAAAAVATASPAPPPPRVAHPHRPRPPEPIPQLRPVPTGQQSIAKRPVSPPAATASASPGPQTGLPGRPGVAPRPGEVMPGQGGKGAAPPRAAGTPRPMPPARRPAGNGPFRPITPAGVRPGAARPGAAPSAETPAPSSGARPGDRARTHEDKAAAKKDREKELLLEKERQRKKKGETAAAAPARTLETIEIPDLLTVQELATSMIVPARDVITELIKIGTMATI